MVAILSGISLYRTPEKPNVVQFAIKLWVKEAFMAQPGDLLASLLARSELMLAPAYREGR